MKIRVTITNEDCAKAFVTICAKYDFCQDVYSGRYVVDGKSILGVLSLDLSMPLTVDMYGGSSEAYSAYIEEIKGLGLFAKTQR